MTTNASTSLWQRLRVAGHTAEATLDTMTADDLDEYFSVPAEGLDEKGDMIPSKDSDDCREIAYTEIDSLIADITKQGSFILALSDAPSTPLPEAFLDWRERQRLSAGTEEFIFAEDWSTISKNIRKRAGSKKGRSKAVAECEYLGFVHRPQEIAVTPTGELKPCFLVNWKGHTPTWEPEEMLSDASNFEAAFDDWDFFINGGA